MRKKGYAEYVKDNTNSRWHSYRVVENKTVLEELEKYRKSVLVK